MEMLLKPEIYNFGRDKIAKDNNLHTDQKDE